MSDKTEKKPKPKGKGMMMKIVGAVVLLGAGGGGVFALVQMGVIGGHAEAKEDNNPKLIRKIGLSLFLSLFVMAPTLEQVNARAIGPYAAGTINAEQAIGAAGEEFHKFMIRQTRERDLSMFADMAKAPRFASPADVPFSILLPAFVTSELKTAFQIGFMLFLPFLVIDLVVSSVLMSLGMMMMSPMVVSLPFKLLLFVLVDGWALLMGSLASSFG